MNAYILQNYGEKIVKIFTEFESKIEKRKVNDRSFGDYQNFILADPTEKKIYLRWILDSYVNSGIKAYEDLLSRVKPALEDYDYLKEKNKLNGDEKIVETYCGIAGCTKKFKEKPGLESLIDSKRSDLEEIREKIEEREQLREDSEIVFENGDLLIIHPKTEAASCHYGRGTKWCTAATRGNNMFNKYNEKGPLYIVLPKNPTYEGEKYQLHFEEEQFMDEKDEPIYLLSGDENATGLSLLLSRYPSLLDFEPVANYEYKDLDFGAKKLTSLPDLPDSLKILYCHNNQLTSLPPLPETLEELNCRNNQLTSLPHLPETLEELNCSNNQLTSLPPLPETLKELSCSNNQLTSLPPLPETLEELYCPDNQLTSLPHLTTLKILSCSNNQLTSLPPLPETLEILYCDSNQLTSLPHLPETLEELWCGGNQLITLPPLPESLKKLNCKNNQLTSLPHLPESLKELDCDDNQLTSLPPLPVSLEILYCDKLLSLPDLPWGLQNMIDEQLDQHNKKRIDLQMEKVKTLPDKKTWDKINERHTNWMYRIGGEKYNEALSTL